MGLWEKGRGGEKHAGAVLVHLHAGMGDSSSAMSFLKQCPLKPRKILPWPVLQRTLHALWVH